MITVRQSFQQRLLLIFLIQTFSVIFFASSNIINKLDNKTVTRKLDLDTESIDVIQEAPQSCEEDDNNIDSMESMCFNNSTKSEVLYRLPNTTYPLHYYLHITTNIHRGLFDYNGNCTIELMVLESTNELVLHASQLNIFKILIDDLTEQTSLKSLSYKIENHMLTIFCTENEDGPATTAKSFMRKHRLRLEIHYSNVISEESIGFYRMTYKTKEGATVIGASTQFEPIFARSALPCYDEPKFKSTFKLRITHGNNYTAISNMPNDGEPISSHANMTTTTFLETPLMSVYLLAFVISNFKNTSMQTGNLLQRIFLPPDAGYLNTTRFLEDSAHAMKAFEELVDIPYSLPKLDHVILKEFFAKGMENWGLITYSSNKFFNFDPLDTKTDFDVLEVQTHELVHQWFGNLVTPEWWTFIWLSEGFATYYGRILMDMLRPQYKPLQLYQSLVCNGGRFYYEEEVMTKYVETPSDIRSSFNRAAYLKAGCTIQMFEHAFGQQVFRRGISRYLRTHANSTVNENDLFDAIQAELVQHHASLSQPWNNSVHDIMYTWTHSEVHPVIKITRNYGNQSSIIRLQQAPAGDERNELFWIPLNFATSRNASFENTSADFYMPPVNEISIDMKTLGLTLSPDDWLLVNKKGTGFYGVIYDSTNMHLITKALWTNHSSIHPQNRISLFFDISNYKSQDRTTENFTMWLECVKYLRHEDNPSVWISAVPLMNVLIDDFRSDELVFQKLHTFLLLLVMPMYEQLANITTVELSVQKSPLFDDLEDIVCILEVEECLLSRKNFVLKFISGEHTDVNETTMQLCSAAKVFNEQEFGLALDFLVGQNKLKMWTGLGCTRNDSLYQNLLEKVFDMTEDEKNCENKLIRFLNFLTIRKLSERKLSWKIFRKNMRRIVDAAPCVDQFFDALSKNLIYIDGSHKEELRSFYDMYFQRNSTIDAFDEAIIGKSINEALDPKIKADVANWLKNELNNYTDNQEYLL